MKITVSILMLMALGMILPAGEATGQDLHFSTFEGSVNALSVPMLVAKLSTQADSSYRQDFAKGRDWNCIAAVVDELVELQRKAEHTAHPEDPACRYWTNYSGHEWTYWRQYVSLAVDAADLEFDRVFRPEVVNLLGEIHAAFLPYLDPDKTDELMGIETPGMNR